MSTANERYEAARMRWAKAAYLSVYDDPKVIKGILPDIRAALEEDPRHVAALVLLSELLMELGSYDGATQVVATLMALEPGVSEHRRKHDLLRTRDRNAIRDYVEGERLPRR